MRITVKSSDKSLWEAVCSQLPDMPSYCGGKGRCGKCKVKILNGEASVSLADRQHLSEKEIEEGYRIACQSIPLTDCEIDTDIRNGETEMQVLSVETAQSAAKLSSCSIAIDIGTTTLAFALLGKEGTVIASGTGLNHQRSFGTDVVSRIELAMRGQEAELTACIRKDIRQGIKNLLRQKCLPLNKVKHIVVAGNTTMEQLFFGFPVEGLGKYPFSPYTENFIKAEYEQLFPDPEEWEMDAGKIPVTGFPCIAGFVGGDITSGLYELTQEETDGVQMFLDIGTNGELACISKKRIITASTAAGPVFEGGNICCGMASLPGAVYATRICEDALECKIIGDIEPEGICGSGLIEAVADLLQMKVVDRQGLMLPVWQETGYLLARGRGDKRIILTQSDIREFQMAKAALAAGLDILCRTAEIKIEESGKFWLAGGLGNGLSVKKAVKTGLLPKCAGRITFAAGNTSLKGAIRLLREGRQGEEKIAEMLKRTEHVHLANAREFEQYYIGHMNF